MKFYILKDPAIKESGKAITEYLPEPPERHGEPDECPVCGACLSLLRWLPPRRAELEVLTNRYGDIAFGPSDELLLSDRFVKSYRDAGLKGLNNMEPVEILHTKKMYGAKPPKEQPGYHYALPGLFNARLDFKASGMVHETPYTCDKCRSSQIVRYKRVILEDNTWSGEDLFLTWGIPGLIMTSQHFADWFDEHQINNGLLIPAEEYSKDFDPDEIGYSY